MNGNPSTERVVFLDGNRLYLRPHCASDVPLLVRWMNDPNIRIFVNRRYPLGAKEEERWIERLAELKNDIVLMIVLKGQTPADDRPIGNIGLHNIELENGIATTGAVIGEKECWGKGYGTEAKMILLNHAFNTLNLRKIYSRVLALNPRSRRYSEKCGYTLIATLPDKHFRDGRFVDELVLEVNADTWRMLWEETKERFLP
ncbi:MAG: GNAT family protein [Minisyncoccia bacterium]